MIYFDQNDKMGKVASGLTDTHTLLYEYKSTMWDIVLNTRFAFFVDNGIMYKHLTGFMNGLALTRSVIDMISFDKVRRAINER